MPASTTTGALPSGTRMPPPPPPPQRLQPARRQGAAVGRRGGAQQAHDAERRRDVEPAGGQQGAAFDDISQFPNVSRPMVGAQGVHGFRTDLGGFDAQAGHDLAYEVIHERWQVVNAFP